MAHGYALFLHGAHGADDIVVEILGEGDDQFTHGRGLVQHVKAADVVVVRMGVEARVNVRNAQIFQRGGNALVLAGRACIHQHHAVLIAQNACVRAAHRRKADFQNVCALLKLPRCIRLKRQVDHNGLLRRFGKREQGKQTQTQQQGDDFLWHGNDPPFVTSVNCF